MYISRNQTNFFRGDSNHRPARVSALLMTESVYGDVLRHDWEIGRPVQIWRRQDGVATRQYKYPAPRMLTPLTRPESTKVTREFVSRESRPR
jgi:hypothetical protein